MPIRVPDAFGQGAGQARTQAPPSAFQRNGASAADFGAVEGQGLQALGRGLSRAGAVGLNISEKMMAERNQAAFLRAKGEVDTALQTMVYDPETGYITRTGSAAQTVVDDFNVQYGKVADAILEKGKYNDAVRTKIKAQVEASANGYRGVLMRHVYSEHGKELESSVKLSVDTAMAKALADPRNPETLAQVEGGDSRGVRTIADGR